MLRVKPQKKVSPAGSTFTILMIISVIALALSSVAGLTSSSAVFRFISAISLTFLSGFLTALFLFRLFWQQSRKHMLAKSALTLQRQQSFNDQLQEKSDDLQIAKFTADKSSIAKTDFLTGMGYEIRTSLSAILGFAQLIESETPKPAAAVLKSLTQILKAGWYLHELVNEIIDVALIDSGKLSLSLEELSIESVIKETLAAVEEQGKIKKISLSFRESGSCCLVRADHSRLSQILKKLLSNAIKHNRENGTVIAEVTLIEKNTVRITIRDSGVGFSPEQINQLFEPFDRIDRDSGAENGTGLGLVVCKKLIEMMGGIIGVESTVGQGSSFWIEMDLVENRRSSPPHSDAGQISPRSRKNPREKKTLLCIEDSPSNLMLIEELIARLTDIRMISSTNGLRGVEMAIDILPDLILMDINLPGMNGIDALKVLKLNGSTARIPIIALSANANPRDIERGLEAGFVRYLTKPILTNDFMSAINYALKSEA